MAHKKCDCGMISTQGVNGKWYCDDHHPGKLCPECNKKHGRFVIGQIMCDNCKREGVKNGR